MIRIRFSESIRARMSSVSSTSCLTDGADRREARRDEVGELPGVGDVRGERLQVVRQQRRQRHHLLEVALDVPLQGVDLEMILLAQHFVGRRHRGAQIRPRLNHAIEPHAREPLDDQPQAAVRQLEHLVDVGRDSDRIEIVLQRLLDRRFALGEHADHPAGGRRLVDQAHRRFARDRQRHERVRKQHRVPQRQDRQIGRNRQRTLRRRLVDDDEGIVSIAHERSS